MGHKSGGSYQSAIPADKEGSISRYKYLPDRLVISLDSPWLAASPDGLVYDPTEPYPNGVVEFKNPNTARNITLKEVAAKTTFRLEHNKDSDTLKLKNKLTITIRYSALCTVLKGSCVTWL